MWIGSSPVQAVHKTSWAGSGRYTNLDDFRLTAGTIVPNGTKVPGTNYQLDPVRGAFNIGAMIRWLDYNDCWLAAEWGHPSDNLGGILAVADWLSRTNKAKGKPGVKMSEVLTGMIQAHEVFLPCYSADCRDSRMPGIGKQLQSSWSRSRCPRQGGHYGRRVSYARIIQIADERCSLASLG